jgi:hypothetical protein
VNLDAGLICVNLVYPSWFQNAAPDGCQILGCSRMQPASRQQVTVGVAYVSVTSAN